MKKMIYFSTVALSLLFLSFSKQPDPKGSVFIKINDKGAVYDNVLVSLDKKIYARLNWQKDKMYISDVPQGSYTVKVFVVDSLKGSYYFEKTNFNVYSGRTAYFEYTNISLRSKKSGMIFPNRYLNSEHELEFTDFPVNDSEVRNLKMKNKVVSKIFGVKSWNEDIDKLAEILIENYEQHPDQEHYIIVTGHASSVEKNGDKDEIYQLSLERAKNVVDYITMNYKIGKEHFVVMGVGDSDPDKEKKPMDGDNRKVVITYDGLF